MAYLDAPADGSTDTNVFVKFSDNNGSSWSSPVRVNDDTGTASQFGPQLAVDQTTGHVAVTWVDPRNDPANNAVRLYATVSQNGGVGFEPSVPVAAAASNGSLASRMLYGTGTVGSDGKGLSDPAQNWRVNSSQVSVPGQYLWGQGDEPQKMPFTVTVTATTSPQPNYDSLAYIKWNSSTTLSFSDYHYLNTPPTGPVSYTIGSYTENTASTRPWPSTAASSWRCGGTARTAPRTTRTW